MHMKSIAQTLLYLVLPVALIRFVHSHQLECQVLVQEPWPMKYLAVPQDSAVEINCTANLGDNSFWAIDPGNDSRAVQYQFGRNGNDVLNRLGVYELPRVEMLGTTTLRLLINDTSAVNNQTKVFCHINAQAALSSTLFIFDQSHLKMSIQDVSLGGINITWSRAAVEVAQIFTLHIVGGSESLYSESLYESYYFFTAPEVAPRCEVYNLSVTATYVGATYIGASCSVSSPVLTMMLPSLPDIEGLERSLKHCVVQHSRDVVLNISFKPASGCEQYPVSHYTAEIQGPLPVTTVEAFVIVNFTVLNTVLENAVYSFNIVVSSSVGNVSTKSRTFYTTDVQMVEVTLIEDSQDASIQCDFMVSSKARGCMVVLTSGHGREDYNLIRNTVTNLATLRVTLKHVVSSYLEVEAFDIEFDGSAGSLAVPGILHVISETPDVNTARSSFMLKQGLRVLIVLFMVLVVLW